jgi:F420-0:gamma-glutamyl ligase-like protein
VASLPKRRKKMTTIKIKSRFLNIGGNGILFVCQLIYEKLKDNDFLLLNEGNKIQIKEVENIVSETDFKEFSFVIPREFENITNWSDLFGTELKVENINN